MATEIPPLDPDWPERAAEALDETPFLVRETTIQETEKAVGHITTGDLRLLLAYLKDVVTRNQTKDLGIAVIRGAIIAKTIKGRGTGGDKLLHLIVGTSITDRRKTHRLSAFEDLDPPEIFEYPEWARTTVVKESAPPLASLPAPSKPRTESV